ncbi:hypothetical protein [Rhodocista pekingensis]|uniref:Uncharacterized protein n=1 Tax=Rhodocista pekingensis TaxID=201185 RepID=A0ABW2L1Z5_9PROT
MDRSLALPLPPEPTLIERAAAALDFGIRSGADAAGTGTGTTGSGSRGPTARPGLLDLDRTVLQAAGVLTPDRLRTRLAEEVRLIKRLLLARLSQNGGPAGKALMLTSALPGEGKTWLAANLAISIANERDLGVVLVDADLARPSLLRLLGVEAPDLPGLSSLLEDAALDAGSCVRDTSIPGLRLLPPGPAHALSTELLTSQRMADLIAEIGRRFPDHVLIFDTAPVLATTLPAALFDHMAEVLFVVEANATRGRDVTESLELLGDPAKVSLVLNKCRHVIGERGAGSRYGYDYESYYGGPRDGRT